MKVTFRSGKYRDINTESLKKPKPKQTNSKIFIYRIYMTIKYCIDKAYDCLIGLFMFEKNAKWKK